MFKEEKKRINSRSLQRILHLFKPSFFNFHFDPWVFHFHGRISLVKRYTTKCESQKSDMKTLLVQ